MMPLDFSSQQTALLTDVGVLRSENQDACSEFRHPTNGAQLLVVADGMGGHQGGATASRMAIDVVGEVFQGAAAADPELLRAALETANDRIYHTALEHTELHGMGTTCVALLICADGTAWVGHVGDSRAYQLRAGEIHPITADHSAVAEMERRGMITAEEAAVHPRRNELLRSVGVEPDVEADVSPVEIHEGDQFLLCSDGLCGVVADREMADVLLRQEPKQAVRQLVDQANARGGPDNITVLITAFNPAAVSQAPAPTDQTPITSQPIGGSNQIRRLALFASVIGLLLAAAIGVLLMSGSEPETDPTPAGAGIPETPREAGVPGSGD